MLLTPPELGQNLKARLTATDGNLSFSVLGTDDQVEKLAHIGGEFSLLFSDRFVVDAALATDAASLELATAHIVSFDQDSLRDGAWRAPMLAGCWDPERALAILPQSFFAIRCNVLQRLRLRLPTNPVIAEWDLITRAASSVPASSIIHIPKVRRHRAHGRCEPTVPRKQEMMNEVRSVLDDREQTHAGVVPGNASGCVRVRHALPSPPPLVSIIIPTRNRADLLRTCISGLIHRTNYPALELLIVDNGSDEPDAVCLLADLSETPRAKVMHDPGPFNWAAFNNFAAQRAEGQILLFLNNDIDVIHDDWLMEIASHAMRPEIGAVGAKLLYANGTVQHAGIAMNQDGDAYHAWRGATDDDPGYMMRLSTVGTVSAVTGACLATRKEVWHQVRGFDERMPITYSDVDFCFRVRSAGLRVIYTPHAKLFHYEGSTRGSDARPEEWARLAREAAIFKETWGEWSREEPWLGPHIEADGPTPKLVPTPVARLAKLAVEMPRVKVPSTDDGGRNLRRGLLE